MAGPTAALAAVMMVAWGAAGGCEQVEPAPLMLLADPASSIACPARLKLPGPCVRRGAALPLRVSGEVPQAWTLQIRGRLSAVRRDRSGARTGELVPLPGPVTATLSGAGPGPVGALGSASFRAGGWDREIAGGAWPRRWDGEAILTTPSIRVAAAEGGGQGEPESWWVLPTVQAVAIDFTAGFDEAVARFGLARRSERLRARIVALVQEHFAEYAVEAGREAPPGQLEYVRVEVGDRDPNGLGLLGADNSVGKDTGNQRLGETVGGFNAGARARGRSAYGGVFVGELFVYSARLHPDAAVADKAFDALFGPFAPELGGRPARAAADTTADTAADTTADTTAAVEALAELVAGTISHEVGHTLGLAAGTQGAHHPGDHPLWRMDAGRFRPFSERAGLSGKEVWGPVDAAYLAKILPLQ